jgi:hypothetical protein
MKNRTGEVIRFEYLWARERKVGQTEGSKLRPACIAVQLAETVFVFPITTQPPIAKDIALEVPEVELRRGGLARRSWVIVDEFNEVRIDNPYGLLVAPPIGSFSPPYMAKIRNAALKAISARQAGNLQ